MPRIRFSIAGLIGVIGLVALGLAAIRGASAPWAGLLTSVMFFALIASLLGIGLRRGSRRVFWVGFALLGWGYLALWMTEWGATHTRAYLLAPNLTDALFGALFPEEATEQRDFGVNGGFGGMGGPRTYGGGMGGGFRSMLASGGGGTPPAMPSTTAVNTRAFSQIGRCLEALLWACLGGWVARYFTSDRKDGVRVDTARPA